jgi:phosphoglycolate phosphatase-like HAD superfamily hydrolase
VDVLALDFDGVIADSAREAFAVALRTRRQLLGRDDFGNGAEGDAGLFARFLELMPLGNRAEDYGVILEALAEGVSLPDQPAYDAFHGRQDAAGLAAFHRRFYEVRRAWSDADPQGWMACMPAYPGLGELLRRHAGQVRLAIATAKDRRSVRVLLRAYGMDDLFAAGSVYDKESGVHKRSHIEQIAREGGVDPGAITFVDDKLNHLQDVGALGARCVLAAWGYNGERERRAAREAGYLVCTLEDFEKRVFT